MNLPPPDLPVPSPQPERERVATASALAVAPLNPYAPPVAALPGKADEETNVFEVSESLMGLIKESFAYPVRRGGWGMLGVSAVIVFLISIAGFVPLVGLVVTLGGAAYVAAYYFEIVAHTVHGKAEVPPWPDLSSYWDDIIIPGVQMLGIFLISSLPLFAALWLFPEDKSDLYAPMVLLASVLKWLYFPMATLAVICHGSAWAALPHRVVPALIRCLPGYLVCAGAFALADLVQWLGSAAMGMVPVLGWFLPWVAFMYVMIVQARLTGLIFLRYQERLPWGA
jgi:hypothetical protein